MSEPIDPCDVLARHQHHRGQWGDGACTSRFGGPEHCLAYILASAVVEAELKIERVEEMAHRFELIPRARLLGALAARPVSVSKLDDMRDNEGAEQTAPA